jgi:hypothetical protein
VSAPHLGPGRDTLGWGGEGGRTQFLTTGQKLWYCTLYNIIPLHVYSTGKVPLSTKKRKLEYTLPYSEFGVYPMESAEDVRNKGKGSKFS